MPWNEYSESCMHLIPNQKLLESHLSGSWRGHGADEWISFVCESQKFIKIVPSRSKLDPSQVATLVKSSSASFKFNMSKLWETDRKWGSKHET
jgi:hypothetical protein